VPDDQLSLAIGKKGQNVRLAAKLTGWKIDIMSETRAAEAELDDLTAGEQEEGETADEADDAGEGIESTRGMPAKEAIALIQETDDLEAFKPRMAGENRVTVLRAFEEKAAELTASDEPAAETETAGEEGGEA